MIENRKQVIAELQKVIVGKEKILEFVFSAILAGGNILLEDTAGVGKTTLAKSFGRVLALQMQRVQFTPELIPSDILGYMSYHTETKSFAYEEGPIMCHMFFADELNRASGKTQAALLEAMEEKQITVDKTTYALPEPFFVLATQNPLGTVGTQPLPYSQLDRFMVSLTMGYPDMESQLAILKARQKEQPINHLTKMLSKETLIEWQNAVKEVEVTDEVLRYIIRLAEATRNHQSIQIGISPRGIFALNQMAKAYAWLQNRSFVTPEDIYQVFIPVFSHRIVLEENGFVNRKQAISVLKEIIQEVPVP